LGVESSEKLVTMIEGYREFVVRSRRAYVSEEIGKIRQRLAHTEAEIQFMPNISKYVIEVAIILGAVFISMIQFLMNDSIHAIGTLTIFIAAGSRIAPAVMRLQQGAMTFKRGIGSSRATLLLLSQLKNIAPLESSPQKVNFGHVDFTPTVVARNINFGYENSEEETLHNISFEVFAGESLAIVGPSGSGKSTLIDIVLGILVPQAGEANISNVSPEEALRRWPGSVGYVPQDIVLTSGTIRDNVALGFPMDMANDMQIWDALEIAKIEDYVRQLPGGLDTRIGDRGFMLSGGQKQRLGIARAMFTKPKLLILDEATSALDAQIENEIAASLANLKGKVTLVTVAHRLSTVKSADKVLYLENGKIRALGDFEAVRSKVPNFDSQARLMGL
jgi:ABC-type multidrug transport system fused ATPase/permease subunit